MTKFLEIFNQLLENNGVKRNKVFTDLNLGKTSYANWETRDTIPGGETLIKLANYFGVTIEYLIGESTKVEMKHIQKYRTLDEEGRENVDDVLEVEYKRCTEEQKPMEWAIPPVDESKAVASAEVDTHTLDDPPDTEDYFVDIPVDEL